MSDHVELHCFSEKNIYISIEFIPLTNKAFNMFLGLQLYLCPCVVVMHYYSLSRCGHPFLGYSRIIVVLDYKIFIIWTVFLLIA